MYSPASLLPTAGHSCPESLPLVHSIISPSPLSPLPRTHTAAKSVPHSQPPAVCTTYIHTLFSLVNPHHLPVSTLNSAVLVHNLTFPQFSAPSYLSHVQILTYSLNNNLCSTSSLEHSRASVSQLLFTILIALSCSICPISSTGNVPRLSAFTLSCPKLFRLHCEPLTYSLIPEPPESLIYNQPAHYHSFSGQSPSIQHTSLWPSISKGSSSVSHFKLQ